MRPQTHATLPVRSGAIARQAEVEKLAKLCRRLIGPGRFGGGWLGLRGAVTGARGTGIEQLQRGRIDPRLEHRLRRHRMKAGDGRINGRAAKAGITICENGVSVTSEMTRSAGKPIPFAAECRWLRIGIVELHRDQSPAAATPAQHERDASDAGRQQPSANSVVHSRGVKAHLVATGCAQERRTHADARRSSASRIGKLYDIGKICLTSAA